MNEIRKFIEWLSIRPTSSEIAQALVTEYLSEHQVSRIRICRMNNDGSTMVLGQYGYPATDKWEGVAVPALVWRTWDTPGIDILTGKNKTSWSPDSNLCVSIMRERGVISGSLDVEFLQPVADSAKNLILDVIEHLAAPIALYLSFTNRGTYSGGSSTEISVDSRQVNPGQLTQRQILILRGMVEGKTNHELATEMGFSVSTIRHETMRIYQALAVSDRKEAAKKALSLSLI